MCLLHWEWDLDPTGGASFHFTNDDGELLTSSVLNLDGTPREYVEFARDVEAAEDGKKAIEFNLRFHGYYGGRTIGEDVGQIVPYGTAQVSYTRETVVFTVPVSDFFDGAWLLADGADPLDLRVFYLLSQISPRTFTDYLDVVDKLSTRDARMGSTFSRRFTKPTYRANELLHKEVATVLIGRGVFYFRQLEACINTKAEYIKPHFRAAGLLEEGQDVRNYPVTAEELITKLLPYVEQQAKVPRKLAEFAHDVRTMIGLPAYEKPARLPLD